MLEYEGSRKFANKNFANWTLAIGERPLVFRQYTSCIFANWQISTDLSPVNVNTFANWRNSNNLSPILARVHRTIIYLNVKLILSEKTTNYSWNNWDADISHPVIPNFGHVTGCSEMIFVLGNFHYEHPIFSIFY